MPSALSYPGVYVEEIPSGVRTIAGVATSTTAFVGRTVKGPVDKATEITSYADFARIFGGLSDDCKLSYAVRDFYLNGGARAVIVRVFKEVVPESEREAIATAVAAIVTAAKAGPKGKDAKASAKTAKDKIDGAEKQTQAVKDAAGRALLVINALDDAAAIDAVTQAADAAAKTSPPDRAKIDVGPLSFRAKAPGNWAANLRITVERPISNDDKPLESAVQPAKRLGKDLTPSDLFTLTIRDESPGGRSETFVNLTVKPSVRRVDNVLRDESDLIEWAGFDLDKDTSHELTPLKAISGDAVVEARNALAKAKTEKNIDPGKKVTVEGKETTNEEIAKSAEETLRKAEEAASRSVGAEAELDSTTFLNGGREGKKGLFALEQLFAHGGIFNLLCIPPYKADGSIDPGVLAEAVAYAEDRRAMVIVDPPVTWREVTEARNRFGEDTDNLPRSKNAAVFFPRIKQPNPLHDDQIEEFAPCGVVAGIFARTDVQRGVWKSPAGLDAALKGVSTLSVPMTDEENGLLNPLGINCLRTFPVFGRVVWGARTLRGADDFADEYKYIPVRRTALFIEESLYRGLKWVVFEPNDEPLWAQIRLNVGAFMHNLFRQGAFQGASKRDAYLVKCDAETTTQNDINLGIVNVHVGFAPLKPAEFVVLKVQQMAGQIET